MCQHLLPGALVWVCNGVAAWLFVLWYGEGQREWHRENSKLYYTVWVNRDVYNVLYDVDLNPNVWYGML